MSTKNKFTCDICFDDYDESDKKPLLLQCTHFFCKQCLLQMQISGNKQCPKCRHSWVDTSVDELEIYCNLDHEEGTTSTEDITECSATENCEHPDYAAEFWCQDCEVLLCKICFIEHIDCNWGLVSEVLEDIEEYKKLIILAKYRITNRTTEAITENEGRLANIKEEIESLRLQEGKLVKSNTSHLVLLKTTLDELNMLDNVSIENQDIAKVQELMKTIKDLGGATLPEDPLPKDMQPTTPTDHPSPAPSSSLQSATEQTSSPSANQGTNVTPGRELDPDTLCPIFLSASDKQRNEVRVCHDLVMRNMTFDDNFINRHQVNGNMDISSFYWSSTASLLVIVVIHHYPTVFSINFCKNYIIHAIEICII